MITKYRNVHLGNETAESSSHETVEGWVGAVSADKGNHGTRDAAPQVSGNNALLSGFTLVLCEYSQFQIESNSYFSIRFDSKRAQLFEIFEYLPSPISYLFNRMTPIFHLSNHA